MARIKVTKRKGKGSGFICPRCKHYNVLGAYWAGHQHVVLTGPCKNDKCDAHFQILGTDITLGGKR